MELRRQIKVKEKTIAAFKTVFSEAQLKKLTNPMKRVCWSANDFDNAVAIYSAGPKAYKLLLENKYPFPALPTITKMMRQIKNAAKNSSISTEDSPINARQCDQSNVDVPGEKLISFEDVKIEIYDVHEDAMSD